jgi:geranylgeranyl transferase type-2 subunit beta
MSYLADLALRLASGTAQLDDALLARHADWLLAAQQPDGGFAGREGASDLYYTSFGLRGLALTGRLDGPPAQKACDFLAARLHDQVTIVDFLSLVYAAALLETSAGLDPFAKATPRWREAVAERLERFRRADGGYARTEEGAASSTYHSFLMLACLEQLGAQAPDKPKLAAFVISRQREDGGFVEIGPMQRSGTNPTAAALAALHILGQYDSDAHARAIDFLADMQTDEGGLRANTRIPLADLLSTFTGLLSLADAGAAERIDPSAAKRYALSLEQDEGGFRGGVWDAGADVEYTFYGLATLALLAS